MKTIKIGPILVARSDSVIVELKMAVMEAIARSANADENDAQVSKNRRNHFRL